MHKTRPYTYYDFTLSLCPVCLKRIDAKIIFQGKNVFMQKTCSEHGYFKVLVSSDKDYYQRCRNYLKAGDMPLKFNTQVHYGCPYDCGLCTDHEQHSCLSLIEITDRCNLTCPTCYASSSPHNGNHRSLTEIKALIDLIVSNEGEPDVMQISGGEPTLHPGFFDVLDYAKTKPVKHLMVNTNGIRIAKDESFVRSLASYMPDFEIYLQFDSLRKDVLKKLRGEDLSAVRQKALEHLNKYNLSTTLVVTLEKGLNDDEIGSLIDFALKQDCVRGITFQPTSISGRLENFDPAKNSLTLACVRNKILEQSEIFTEKDILPVPCNPDAIAMAYALKSGNTVSPLTRYIDPAQLLESGNTIVYEQDEQMHSQILKLFSTGTSPVQADVQLKQLLCCLPEISAAGLKYENLFRIIIMHFTDAWNFDVRAIKKSCVHIAGTDGKIYPFETYNLLYREKILKASKEMIPA
jgi:7,8-dihydro-6-hydroxymethylpterin dimethyltransferase